jgi:copper chaperone CopZ
MKKAKLTIHGMHCSSCAANIERSLNKTPGIKNATVSLLLKKATVEAEDSVKDEDFKTAVKRAGYEVKSIEYE